MARGNLLLGYLKTYSTTAEDTLIRLSVINQNSRPHTCKKYGTVPNGSVSAFCVRKLTGNLNFPSCAETTEPPGLVCVCVCVVCVCVCVCGVCVYVVCVNGVCCVWCVCVVCVCVGVCV